MTGVHLAGERFDVEDFERAYSSYGKLPEGTVQYSTVAGTYRRMWLVNPVRAQFGLACDGEKLRGYRQYRKWGLCP